MGDIPNKEEARGIAATYEGMVLSDGKMHCPALLTLQQAHDPVADYRQGKIDEAEFRRLMALRERLEMRVHSVEEDGSVRVACPALDGRVSCPLRRSDLKAKKAGMKKVSGGKAPLPLSPKQTPKRPTLDAAVLSRQLPFPSTPRTRTSTGSTSISSRGQRRTPRSGTTSTRQVAPTMKGVTLR
ncbi:hypothetical protein D9B85_08460 [Corynebacterium diphtheriae]|nr:hypothetical protein D9B85_08460 [Corynebacterium diphtheriae]